MRTKISVLCMAVLLVSITTYGAKSVIDKKNLSLNSAKETKAVFIKADGNHLILNNANEAVYLRGINVTNSYWSDPEKMLQGGSGAKDYANIKAMGMNTVRLSLNHGMFEKSDKPYVYNEKAWKWVDANIRNARANGLWVILDMHIPIGSDWLSSGVPQDYSIWTDKEKQNRFKALWKAIASRYKNNPTVAGYDLMNEPVTDDQNGKAYEKLIQETVQSVRQVDTNHLLIIEKLYGVNKNWEIPEGVEPQFLVNDTNVMYDFHFYQPIDYTHQYADWSDNTGDGGSYPDDMICTLSEDANYLKSKGENYLPQGSTDWRYMETKPITIEEKNEVLAAPSLYFSGGFQKIRFSQLMLYEMDLKGQILRTVPLIIDANHTLWYWWSEDATGAVKVNMTGGPKGEPAMEVSGIKASAALTASKTTVVLKKDRKYKIGGWAKGEGLQPNAWCGMQMDINEIDTAKLITRNKAGLSNALNEWLAFGEEHKVPVNVGEWGLIKHCFENGKGGEKWVSDMLDLLLEKKLNFQYWDYHSDAMGIYLGEGLEPIENAKVNQAVVDLFKKKLGSKGVQ